MKVFQVAEREMEGGGSYGFLPPFLTHNFNMHFDHPGKGGISFFFMTEIGRRYYKQIYEQFRDKERTEHKDPQMIMELVEGEPYKYCNKSLWAIAKCQSAKRYFHDRNCETL